MFRKVPETLCALLVVLLLASLLQAQDSKQPMEEVLPALSKRLAEKVEETAELSTSAKRDVALQKFARALTQEFAEKEVEIRIPIRDISTNLTGDYVLHLADTVGAEDVPGLVTSLDELSVRLTDEELASLDRGHYCVLTGKLSVGYYARLPRPRTSSRGRDTTPDWLRIAELSHDKLMFLVMMSEYRVTYDTSKRAELPPAEQQPAGSRGSRR